MGYIFVALLAAVGSPGIAASGVALRDVSILSHKQRRIVRISP